MKVKTLVLIAAFITVAATVSVATTGRSAALASFVPTNFATAPASCNKTGFFGLKPWYAYMPDSEIGVPRLGDIPADPCGIHCFNIFPQQQENECHQTASDIPGVVLAIIDDLLRIAGLVAVAFVIIGAFQYVASRGNAERTASAQSTIINALTGLAIAMVAVALVAYLGNRLG